MTERQLPASVDAERSILGAILANNANFHKAAERIRSDDFYLGSHRLIFTRMAALMAAGTAVDIVTLQDLLVRDSVLESAGGVAYLAELMIGVPTITNIDHHLTIVVERSSLRQMIAAANSITAECLDGGESAAVIFDRAQTRILEIGQGVVKSKPASAAELVVPTTRIIERLFTDRQLVTGLATGFTDVDSMTAGLQSGDLIILGARPGAGKTSAGLNIAQHAAVNQSKTVLVFSLEMSKEQLMLRIVSSMAMVDSNKIRTGYLSTEDFQKLMTVLATIESAPLFIDDGSSLTLLEMSAKAHRVKAQHGLDLIVLDYVQLMMGSGKQESRQQEVSIIARGLKRLARELNVPILALAQLNRTLENRADKRPQLSDLRESGELEQAADLVMFLHREEMYAPTDENQGLAELIIAKARNGPTGTLKLAFLRQFTRFETLMQVY